MEGNYRWKWPIKPQIIFHIFLFHLLVSNAHGSSSKLYHISSNSLHLFTAMLSSQWAGRVCGEVPHTLPPSGFSTPRAGQFHTPARVPTKSTSLSAVWGLLGSLTFFLTFTGATQKCGRQTCNNERAGRGVPLLSNPSRGTILRHILWLCFSHTGGHHNHLKSWLKHELLNPIFQSPDSVSLRRDPRHCLSNNLPVTLRLLVQRQYFENHCSMGLLRILQSTNESQRPTASTSSLKQL